MLYYCTLMAETTPSSKKSQISLDEYLKINEKRAKSKLKLQFPMIVKIIVMIPVGYLAFLVIYFLIYLRFVAEH